MGKDLAAKDFLSGYVNICKICVCMVGGGLSDLMWTGIGLQKTRSL